MKRRKKQNCDLDPDEDATVEDEQETIVVVDQLGDPIRVMRGFFTKDPMLHSLLDALSKKD